MKVTPNEMSQIGQFSVQYTFFLSMWNSAEASAYRIIQLLLGESDTAMAVSVELSSKNAMNAILAGAKDLKHRNIKEHLEHFAIGYDRLRDYRNYYAHALVGVSPQGGHMVTVSGKGRLRFDKDVVQVERIEEMKNHASRLFAYGSAIEQELGAKGEGLTALLEAYEASLEKPTWPEPLTKTSHWIQER